jgi:hypothetical protein
MHFNQLILLLFITKIYKSALSWEYLLAILTQTNITLRWTYGYLATSWQFLFPISEPVGCIEAQQRYLRCRNYPNDDLLQELEVQDEGLKKLVEELDQNESTNQAKHLCLYWYKREESHVSWSLTSVNECQSICLEVEAAVFLIPLHFRDFRDFVIFTWRKRPVTPLLSSDVVSARSWREVAVLTYSPPV